MGGKGVGGGVEGGVEGWGCRGVGGGGVERWGCRGVGVFLKEGGGGVSEPNLFVDWTLLDIPRRHP